MEMQISSPSFLQQGLKKDLRPDWEVNLDTSNSQNFNHGGSPLVPAKYKRKCLGTSYSNWWPENSIFANCDIP